MRLKAVDTLHVSSVKPDNILPGEEFEVSDDIGRQIAERGLATEVRGIKPDKPEETKPEETKAEPAPLNKMTAPPANKATQHKKGR